MLADDVACNPRNPFAGTVFSNADRKTDLYGEAIEVDFKGEEVNVETFLRLLSGAFQSRDGRTEADEGDREATGLDTAVEATDDGLEVQHLCVHDGTWGG
jgi:glycosylphosphatidylinositol transamidase (GPIT) subunit GPI8